jgi:hypothetical protein
MRVPFYSTSSSILGFVFFMITTVTRMKSNLRMVFIYGKRCWTFLPIFIRHLYFFWQLSIQYACLIISLDCLLFWCLMFEAPSKLRILILYSLKSYQIFLCHSLCCLLTLVIVYFYMETLFHLVHSYIKINSYSYFMCNWNCVQKIIKSPMLISYSFSYVYLLYFQNFRSYF